MAVRYPRYSEEKFARCGDEIYESQVRSLLKPDNYGKIVAIALKTRAFEVIDENLAVTLFPCEI
jgi:hypothetical protein